MADWATQFPELDKTGGRMFAISVDDPARSASLRERLKLPFEILSDSSRETIARWGLLNAKEKGGIAIPATFVIDSNLIIRRRWAERTAARISAVEVIAALKTDHTADLKVQRVRPGFRYFLVAILNSIRGGVRAPTLKANTPGELHR